MTYKEKRSFLVKIKGESYEQGTADIKDMGEKIIYTEEYIRQQAAIPEDAAIQGVRIVINRDEFFTFKGVGARDKRYPIRIKYHEKGTVYEESLTNVKWILICKKDEDDNYVGLNEKEKDMMIDINSDFTISPYSQGRVF